MQAIVQDRYGTEDVLELRNVEVPAPAEKEVLVRVRAVGVDPGVWHVMTGIPYLVRLMGFGLRAPKTPVPGTDVAGRVEAVGEGVTLFRPGDDVFGLCRGALAEYAVAREDRLAPKPASLTMEDAAAVPSSGLTALQGLRDRAGVRPGQEVLVVGAGGGVGTFAVQLARAFGATVTGVCSTDKTDVVRTIGADRVVDYTREDLDDVGVRWDVILDAAGLRPLSRLRSVLAREGTLVLVGGEGGSRWFGGVSRQLRALIVSPFVSQALRPMLARGNGEDLRLLARLVDEGELRPVVGASYPFGEVRDAVRYVGRGHVRGKVVVAL